MDFRGKSNGISKVHKSTRYARDTPARTQKRGWTFRFPVHTVRFLSSRLTHAGFRNQDVCRTKPERGNIIAQQTAVASRISEEHSIILYYIGRPEPSDRQPAQLKSSQPRGDIGRNSILFVGELPLLDGGREEAVSGEAPTARGCSMEGGRRLSLRKLPLRGAA